MADWIPARTDMPEPAVFDPDHDHPAARAALAKVCKVIRQSDLDTAARRRLLLEFQLRDVPVIGADLGL